MKANFIWLFITFYLLDAAFAENVRSKRDLTHIQNIIKWLLGINERTLIQTDAVIENDEDRIFSVPKVLVRTVPRTEINENTRHILTDSLYPERILRPVETIRNYPSYPIPYNNYPLQQEYIINDKEYDHYRYERPIYPYVKQVPIYKEPVPSIYPVSVPKVEPCEYNTRTIVKEIRQPQVPQPPMYIQNRLREVMLNPVPAVKVQEEIVVPPPSLRKVSVPKYSVIEDRVAIKETILPKNTVKPNEEQFKPVEQLKRDNDEIEVKTNDIEKKITLGAPVLTKYKYKMIYHNQPQRSTAVEMDSEQSQCAKEKTKVSADGCIEKTNNPVALTVKKDKVLSEYVYIPPVNTEMPPPGMSRVNNNTPANSNNYSAVASETRPVVEIDDSAITNANKDKPTRIVVRRWKIKSRPDYDRGDIPESSQ